MWSNALERSNTIQTPPIFEIIFVKILRILILYVNAPPILTINILNRCKLVGKNIYSKSV